MMRSSTVTRRNLSFASTDGNTIGSRNCSDKSKSQDHGAAAGGEQAASSSWPSTSSVTDNNKSAFPRNAVSVPMKPIRGPTCRSEHQQQQHQQQQQQQQPWYYYFFSGKNNKTRRRRSKFGLWCSRLSQWTTLLQYSPMTVDTRWFLFLLFPCFLFCFIHIPSSLLLLPWPTSHSYHIHQRHEDYQHHRHDPQNSYPQHHHRHAHFWTAATTMITTAAAAIDSRNRALCTYPKSLYLYNGNMSSSSYSSTTDHGAGRGGSGATVAPTKPIHALDWYGKDGDHYSEPDFGGLHIRMLVVDDDLLRHDEESSNRHGYHGDGGQRHPVYYNDRYYMDWYHSDDDEMIREKGATINSNNIAEYNYYAFDDDAKRDPWRHRPYQTTTSLRHEDVPPIHNKTCRRVSWHREMQLNCLNFHEFDFGNHVLHGSSKYIG
jgi:hypothetical protein